MIKDTGIGISDPRVGSVVFFHPWMKKKKDGTPYKPYPVLITSGQYLSGGMLSNFWSWQRVYSTGRLKKEGETGYGNFTMAEGVKVSLKIKIT